MKWIHIRLPRFPKRLIMISVLSIAIPFLIAIVIFFLFINTMNIYKRMVPKDVIFKMKDEGNTIHLTIDDVPYSRNGIYSIVPILNILRQEQVCATLFVIGEYWKSAPDHVKNKIKLAVDDGIVILANHGMTEGKHSLLSSTALAAELDEWKRVVTADVGEEGIVPYYRPGSGTISNHIMNESSKRGLKVTLGNIYTFDLSIPCDFIHVAIMSFTCSPGSIIILHDRLANLQKIRRTIAAWKYLKFKMKMLPKTDDSSLVS